MASFCSCTFSNAKNVVWFLFTPKLIRSLVNPLVPDFLFYREKWLVLLLWTSGECIDTNFHFTDKWSFYMIFSLYCPIFGTPGTKELTLALDVRLVAYSSEYVGNQRRWLPCLSALCGIFVTLLCTMMVWRFCQHRFGLNYSLCMVCLLEKTRSSADADKPTRRI